MLKLMKLIVMIATQIIRIKLKLKIRSIEIMRIPVTVHKIKIIKDKIKNLTHKIVTIAAMMMILKKS